MEELLSHRLQLHHRMSEEELRTFLTPRHTWSEAHLRRRVRRLQTRPFTPEERQRVYQRLDSDYVRATARYLMDEVASEAFWKHPPPELEALRARFKALVRTLVDEAVRLGVYVSREAYERHHWRQGREGARRSRHNGFRGGPRGTRLRMGNDGAHSHFAVLGLAPSATLAEVKAAYREKVKEHHPDQGGAVQDFIRLQEAYEFLVTQVF